MHLTKNARKNSGFTLVELIVVITILAILATVGFVSYQQWISQSKNTVRSTDLTNLKGLISMKHNDGVKISRFVASADAAVGYVGNKWTGAAMPRVAGSNSTANDLFSGELYYGILGLNDEMHDPENKIKSGESKGQAYRFGGTDRKGGQFQLAATLAGNQIKAIQVGTYNDRHIGEITGTWQSDNRTFKPDAASMSDAGKLLIGDVLTDKTTPTKKATIINITADGDLYFPPNSGTAGAATFQALDEDVGLIGSGYTVVTTDVPPSGTQTGVIDGSFDSLPYPQIK